ncbi:MAG: hypothetical protein Q9161_000026 [Pseudevernia consocians]
MKVTADNSIHGGIHPIVSLESHQENLAALVSKALLVLPNTGSSKPDFISVTRGPGMRSSLTTGLDTAKGLAVAWQIPLVGVNHMQAHALTPRLVSALAARSPNAAPAFPFLSLLVSGGHTLLVHSRELTDHEILATATDIAIGDCIDKIARLVLRPGVLKEGGDIMYGRLLERFAFPNGSADFNYTAPTTRAEEIARKSTRWGWALVPPLAETRSGSKSKAMEFSFSGLGSAVKRICEGKDMMQDEERIELASESMRLAFEHLASRVGWALRNLKEKGSAVGTLVVSGGVASNAFLRTVLGSFLTARGFPDVKLAFPPVELCTDNAAMVAWTGMEMYENGWESDLRCRALRKWSIDPRAEDGGILGADCWKAQDI